MLCAVQLPLVKLPEASRPARATSSTQPRPPLLWPQSEPLACVSSLLILSQSPWTTWKYGNILLTQANHCARVCLCLYLKWSFQKHTALLDRRRGLVTKARCHAERFRTALERRCEPPQKQPTGRRPLQPAAAGAAAVRLRAAAAPEARQQERNRRPRCIRCSGASARAVFLSSEPAGELSSPVWPTQMNSSGATQHFSMHH